MTVFRVLTAQIALLCSVFLLTSAAFASPHHRRHPHAPAPPKQVALDLTPVVVQPYLVPLPTGPVQAGFLKRMNLENGVEVRGTRGIAPSEVTTRNLFILSVTQSLEGGYDSVNLYDKGVLSWGVMQWTAGTGSLPPTLTHIKRRLMQTGQKAVWDKVFVRQGLDADAHHLVAYGKPLLTVGDMRRAFRGSALSGNYDPKVASYWATVFARAGRQPAVQQFQCEYAEQVVDSVLAQTTPNQKTTLADLCGRDPFAEALLFALWTNNPRHALEYAGDAAQLATQKTGDLDPALWGASAFRDALLARCRLSHFSNWKERGELIASRAAGLHTALAASLTPYERLCQAALSARKVQLAAGQREPPSLRPLLSHHHRPARRGILKAS